MADTLIREAIAYGSQPLSPVPQYWDGSSYAKVQGINGAIRVINYNSAGETFTGASPASVKLTATSTVNFSGSGTVVVSGTSTVNFSGSGTVEVVFSAGGSAAFSRSNPGHNRPIVLTGLLAVYSATITWTSGTTATSVQTLTISAITATETTGNVEVVVTNNGPYAITTDIYKTISANGSSYNTSSLATFISPAEITSGGVTINAVRLSQQALFNFNQGLVVRFTVTAAFTATVTNNIIIKELL